MVGGWVGGGGKGYVSNLSSGIFNFGTWDPGKRPRSPQEVSRGRLVSSHPMTGSAPDAQGVYGYICFFFKEGGRGVRGETRSAPRGGRIITDL